MNVESLRKLVQLNYLSKFNFDSNKKFHICVDEAIIKSIINFV